MYNNVKDLLALAKLTKEANDPELNEAKLDSLKAKIEIEGRKSFFKLRSDWSKWVSYWISFLLVFQAIFTFCLGFGWINFEKYTWFLPTLLIENFLQIIGLGYIVVNFLYPKK